MRKRLKQAGLTFLSLLAVVIAFAGYAYLIAQSGNRSAFVGYVGLAIVCLVTYLAAARWIERRVPTEFSLHHALPALGAGLLGGIAMFSAVMAILWAAGAYRAEGWAELDAAGIALALVLWFAVAVQEEILYRGLLFRLCSKIAGTWGALLLSAALFGASHVLNPGWTLAGLFSVALAGVFLGAAYAATGRLWLPIGLHAGWNFTQGSVFGLQVSGNNVGSGLITGSLNGPDYLTGGRFGPEATIAAVIVVIAVAAYLVWRTEKLGRTEPPIWSATEPASDNAT